jgi:cupin 2 domain-containing protein
MKKATLLEPIPADLPHEITDVLVRSRDVKIERIVSKGHCSPAGFWYDEPQNEWVLLVKGEARIRFEQGDVIVRLTPGCYLNISAHEKHRVEWTADDQETIWLAVFY